MESRYKFPKSFYLNAVFSIDYILNNLEMSLESLNSKIAIAPNIAELKINVSEYPERLSILQSTLIISRIEATDDKHTFKLIFTDGFTLKVSSQCVFITLKIFTASYRL